MPPLATYLFEKKPLIEVLNNWGEYTVFSNMKKPLYTNGNLPKWRRSTMDKEKEDLHQKSKAKISLFHIGLTYRPIGKINTLFVICVISDLFPFTLL